MLVPLVDRVVVVGTLPPAARAKPTNEVTGGCTEGARRATVVERATPLEVVAVGNRTAGLLTLLIARVGGTATGWGGCDD